MSRPVAGVLFALLAVTPHVWGAPPGDVPLPKVRDQRFALDLFAREPDVVTPVGIDLDEAGRVFVGESHTHFPKPDYPGPKSDRILILEDGDRDGRADRFTVFAEGFVHLMSLKLLAGGGVLAATRSEVLRLTDTDSDGDADSRVTLARLETRGDYPHNGLSGFAIDDLGGVFFSLGENLGAGYRLIGADGRALAGGGEGGNIYRMRLDGSGLELWATGFWNTFHVAFDGTGNLFAVDNDPDSRPPCRLLHIVRGGDYGYRFRLGRKGLHPFTSWNGRLPGTLPMVSGTGEAPSGILLCDHPAMPAEHLGKLLVTSWGDHRLELHRLEPYGATFRSVPQPIVEGGETFRPVGIAAGPDGAVYFTDWVDSDYHVHRKGRVWCLRPVPGAEGPDAARDAWANLRGAYRSLLELRAGGRLTPAVLDRFPAAGSNAASAGSNAASAGSNAASAGGAAARAGAGELRAAAVRLLGERGLASSSTAIAEAVLREAFPAGEAHGSPRARLEAVLHLSGEVPLSLAAGLFCHEEDAFLRAAALDAAARLAPGDAVAALGRSSSACERLFALLVFRRLGGLGRTAAPFAPDRPALGVDAVRPFLRDPDRSVRRAALEWVGEENVVEVREELESVLSAGPVDGEVLDAYVAAAALLAGENPQARDSQARDDFLGGLACDDRRPAPLRVLALRAVSSAYRGAGEASLEKLLADPDRDVRREAVRRLRVAAGAAAEDHLAQAARRQTDDRDLRREAVVGLALLAERDGTREVLVELLDDADEVVRREAARSLRGVTLAGAAQSRRDALEAETRGGGEALARSTAAWTDHVLSGGDPREGEVVFFHPRGPRCSSCHTVGGRGGPAGPDLSSAGSMPRARLLDSLLAPSREIAPRYATAVIATQAATRSGILLGEDDDGSLVLADAQGAVAKIPRRDVLWQSEEKTSLMPENIAEQLTTRELRDLLAYLESLR